MSFIDKFKNFRFIDDDRDIFVQSKKFASYLKQKDIKEVEIYLSSACDFCIAFFGAMMAGAVAYILPKPIFSGEMLSVRDENFAEFLDVNDIYEINLNEDSKFYLQTSGSTGKSKNIKKSLKSMIVEGEYLAKIFGFSPENIIFASVSHQHMFGLAYRIFLPMMIGSKAIARELNYPEAILELDLNNHVLITSPVLLKALVQSPRADEIKPICGIVSAGSELKSELRQELNKLCNAKIIDIYGSTETGTIAQNLGDGLMLLEPVKGGLDEREALNVSSPWCEFFQSNDCAGIEGSRLILRGRIDRIIKLNDKRISLESIEKKLFESGILSDCYCAVHPKFKRAVALLELNKSGLDKFRKFGKAGIVGQLKEILKIEYKNSVRHFKIVESLPRNPQGKFSKDKFEEVLFRQISPKWARSKSDVWEYKFSCVMSVELDIFTHHFARLPLVPGFFQLDFVFALASSVGVKFSDKTSVENLKFTKFVRPNDTLDVCFDVSDDKINFELFCNGEKCSSGRIKFDI
ncbi:AMP-binding protein [Campylobacter sp. MOP51]|uniref:AMP-binding protein n=1 Tax=Campylobacter canis TaxID=3378588 RepID=UPI003C3A1A75